VNQQNLQSLDKQGFHF